MEEKIYNFVKNQIIELEYEETARKIWKFYLRNCVPVFYTGGLTFILLFLGIPSLIAIGLSLFSCILVSHTLGKKYE